MLRNDDGDLAALPFPAVCPQRAQNLGEPLQLVQRLLRLPRSIGEPEVQLEDVMAIRILVTKIVVVAVRPGEPAARAGEQRAVEHLPVVGGSVIVRREVGADAELLEHDGPVEAARELARERRRQELPDRVVLHRIAVRADEVDERCERAQRIAVVTAGHLDAPGAVADRHRLRCPACSNRLHDEARPRGHLLDGSGAAVEGHLVRDEPAGDCRMAVEAPGQLLREPRLLPDEPDVAVEVAPAAPRRVPVLARHVPDDEGGDRAETVLGVRVEEVCEALQHDGVELLGRRNEVGPEAKRPRDVAAVRRQRPELLADDGRVVASPHPWAARPGPVVHPEPGLSLKRRDHWVAKRNIARRHHVQLSTYPVQLSSGQLLTSRVVNGPKAPPRGRARPGGRCWRAARARPSPSRYRRCRRR